MSGTSYVGRFAPSPTGPLHFGSLLAALGSFLEARRAGGQWLVRIEDLDPPREVPGSSDAILRTLERCELTWDGNVLYQSSRVDAYRVALEALQARRLAYRCRCSRREVATHNGVYPGTCRHSNVPGSEEHAIRVLTDDIPVVIDDGVQGRLEQRLQAEVGDFVIWRRDGLPAYHLAVTVDDAWQGITHIVRGFDLLASTPRQTRLRQLLSLPEPRFSHLPVALDPNGQKLSKKFGAAALPRGQSGPVMFKALSVLRQEPPVELSLAPSSEIIEWGIKNWDIRKLQGISTISLDDELNPVNFSSGQSALIEYDS